MTALNLEAIEERASKATAGPWALARNSFDDPVIVAPSKYGPAEVVLEEHEPNRVFIAHAREDIPALVAEARRLHAALALADAAIDRVRRRHPRGDEEDGPLAPGRYCPCGQERADNGYGACPDRLALTETRAGR